MTKALFTDGSSPEKKSANYDFLQRDTEAKKKE